MLSIKRNLGRGTWPVAVVGLLVAALACSLPTLDVDEWYVATTGDDSNSCTSPSEPCRTIEGALSKTGGSGGVIHVAGGTYTENVRVDQSITIEGAGADSTIIDGGANGAVFHVIGPSDEAIKAEEEERISVIISDVTMQNGRVDNGGGVQVVRNVTFDLIDSVVRENYAIGNAGGILNFGGRVTLNGVEVMSNESGHGCSAIDNYGVEMEIFRVEIRANEGTTGSAICNREDGAMALRSSQVVDHPFSGIYNEGDLNIAASTIAENKIPGETEVLTSGVYSVGTLSVVDSSIRGNLEGITTSCRATILSSTVRENDEAGVVYSDPNRGESPCLAGDPDLLIRNSTISGNGQDGFYMVPARGSFIPYRIEHVTIAHNQYGVRTEVSNDDPGEQAVVNTLVVNNTVRDCTHHTIPSLGINLDSDDSCNFSGFGHLTVEDVHLEALADNGGSTLTHGLGEGSLARDAAPPSFCPSADQRGVERPVGGGCDIGAYEASFAVMGDEPTPTEAALIEVNFNADLYTIERGQCTTLRWEVIGASMVTLLGDEVENTGAEQVCPSETTGYTLMAENDADEVSEYLEIEVTEPTDDSPPPGPTPTPQLW